MTREQSFTGVLSCLIFLWIVNSGMAGAPLEATSHTATLQAKVDQILSDLENAHRGFFAGSIRNSTPEEKEKSRRANEDLVNSVQEIRALGDLATDQIVQKIQQAPKQSSFRDHLIGLLKSMNGPKAQLVRRAFFTKNQNPNRNPNLDLSWIEGLELDEELLSKVLPRIQSLSNSNPALRVLEKDPSSKFSKEKVQAIVQSMQSIVGKPRMALGYRSWEGFGIGSLADVTYHDRVWTLANMQGVDEAIRNEIEDQPKGIIRDLLRISLAARGAMPSGRKQLKAFLKNQEYRTLIHNRLFCVNVFNQSGDKTDLPFLQEMATSDPYCVEEYAYYQKCEKWGEEYINRTELQIKNESTSFAPLQTVDEKQIPIKVTYPLREAAQKAIEAIEARTEAEDKSNTPKPEGVKRAE